MSRRSPPATRPCRLLLLLAGVFVAAPATPAAGQELFASYARLGSDVPELDDARGAGISVAFPLGDAVRMRTAFAFRSRTTERVGLTCLGFDALGGLNCAEEPIRQEVRLHTLDVSVLPRYVPLPWLRISGGGGVTVSFIAADATSESERDPAWEVPKRPQLGALAEVSLGVRPLRRPPLAVDVAWRAHWVNMDGCVRDFRYDPFCGTERLDEVRIALGYLFDGGGW